MPLINATETLEPDNFTEKNQTDVSQTWTVAPIVSIILLITGVTGDSILLYLFHRDRILITPFNVYIVNLLLADLVDILFQYPFDIVNSLYPVWYLGDRLCTLYMYGVWVGGAVTTNAHLLIATNRIWAVVLPHSYRQYHSVRTAAGICVFAWLVAYATVWPWVIRDALYYREPVDAKGCFVNQPAQFGYSVFVEVGLYCIPNGVVLLVLPVVMHRVWARKRLRQRARPAGGQIEMVASVSGKQSSRLPNPVPGKTVSSSLTGSGGGKEASPSKADLFVANTVGVGRRRRVVERSNGNLVLIVMTCSMMVTYTTTNAIYTASVFLPDYDWTALFVVANVLWSLQPTVDVVLFIVTIKDLRKAFLAMFSHTRCQFSR